MVLLWNKLLLFILPIPFELFTYFVINYQETSKNCPIAPQIKIDKIIQSYKEFEDENF